jgi:lipopolysaccharide/colanic/teichoic acid biosynthesis glycosyltransferase
VSYRGKRVLDVAIAAPLLVASLPVQAAAAVAVRVTMGSPVLFRQERPGLHGRPFELVKFRTMRLADPSVGSDRDAERMTLVGRALRTTSVDELPTLWNVLVGEMSLVGPRPLLPRYLDRYSARQARRHEVKPGITGLAQVSGRNALSWESKLELDAVYVESATFAMDLQILARTVVNTVRRQGISAEGHPTMPEFRGSGHESQPLDRSAGRRQVDPGREIQ